MQPCTFDLCLLGKECYLLMLKYYTRSSLTIIKMYIAVLKKSRFLITDKGFIIRLTSSSKGQCSFAYQNQEGA